MPLTDSQYMNRVEEAIEEGERNYWLAVMKDEVDNTPDFDDWEELTDSEWFTMCPVCGGTCDWLGSLGEQNYWRCKDCGVDITSRLGEG